VPRWHPIASGTHFPFDTVSCTAAHRLWASFLIADPTAGALCPAKRIIRPFSSRIQDEYMSTLLHLVKGLIPNAVELVFYLVGREKVWAEEATASV
jgi:hypothetical protein